MLSIPFAFQQGFRKEIVVWAFWGGYLLRSPLSSWICSDIEMHDSASMMVENDEAVQYSEPDSKLLAKNQIFQDQIASADKQATK